MAAVREPIKLRRRSRDPIDPHERRSFEASLLAGSVAQSIRALMETAGVSQRELASRTGRQQPQISQLLRAENMELATAADLAWALGYRFELVPVPAQRRGTPAVDDPPPPSWVKKLARELLSRL
jgi:transcriptional regulator with XRE-family HTH domain